MAGRWLDVQSAAQELGISTDAVRKRMQRGSLSSDERDGRRVAWLDDGATAAGREPEVEGSEKLVGELRDQVAYLRSQLDQEREARRRADHIIANLTQANASLAARIPELEAHEASEDYAHREATAVEEGFARTGGDEEEPETGAQRVSYHWLRSSTPMPIPTRRL